jgi:hypothetical protein
MILCLFASLSAFKSIINFFPHKLVCFGAKNVDEIDTWYQFHQQLMRQNPFDKKLQTQIVRAHKSCTQKLLYKKLLVNLLVKLTPG